MRLGAFVSFRQMFRHYIALIVFRIKGNLSLIMITKMKERKPIPRFFHCEEYGNPFA